MAFSGDFAQTFEKYLNALSHPFVKLCRLRFLNPDGSTAFALDNRVKSRFSSSFIADGTLSVNLQNGQRRRANVILSNEDGTFDFDINKIWFGQQVAIDEGLVLPDGSDFYLPQGVFYVEEPSETFMPSQKTIELSLADKWSYLDGSLFGNLDATYQVPVGTNIFEAMASVLAFDRGNGTVLDNVPPLFTEYYNGKTQTLPDGSVVNVIDSPYTLTIDNESGTYADILLGLAQMLNAWIGYDAAGRLRVDASQDDILDTTKPVLFSFSPDEAKFLGATYTVKAKDVYNDVIIVGEALDDNSQAAGRAVNMDPSSDTNIYTSLGRRTVRESASGYYTDTQCVDLAVWRLKRLTVLQKAVSISCGQIFHISENNLVTIRREDKPGAPVERHLIQGFSRPLAGSGSMTISAVSVNDYPMATTEKYPPDAD